MDHAVVTLTRTSHNSMAVEDKHWLKDENTKKNTDVVDFFIFYFLLQKN